MFGRSSRARCDYLHRIRRRASCPCLAGKRRLVGQNGAEIAPSEPAAERDDYGQVVLAQRRRDALARLNRTLPAEALEDAFRKLTRRRRDASRPRELRQHRDPHRRLSLRPQVAGSPRGTRRSGRGDLPPSAEPLSPRPYIHAFADALPYPASWTRTFLSTSLAASHAGSSCAGIGRAKKKP